jgi:pentatricopeptide repeat protein
MLTVACPARGRSSLIAACERAGELDQALQLVDAMHAAGFNHLPELYAKLIERCAPACGSLYCTRVLVSACARSTRLPLNGAFCLLLACSLQRTRAFSCLHAHAQGRP